MNNAGLVVTGIANTMDLPERFQAKIASRQGHKRIIFAPYKRDDLKRILSRRLDDIGIFTPDAIMFACARVASYSGDARKTF
jgi:origin recognition complex subunit 1